MSLNKVTIYTDGASRGNPGKAAVGIVIKDEADNAVARISQRLGITTNNQAEYQGVILALEKALSLGARHITLYSDSELVVKQIKGQYRVKNAALAPLYQKVIKLLSQLDSFKFINIPREKNSEADSLANLALDNS